MNTSSFQAGRLKLDKNYVRLSADIVFDRSIKRTSTIFATVVILSTDQTQSDLQMWQKMSPCTHLGAAIDM